MINTLYLSVCLALSSVNVSARIGIDTSVTNTTSLPDTLLFKKAIQAAETEKYDTASQLYIKLYNQQSEEYKQIYQSEVEDLRKTYHIDKLRLENSLLSNKLLRRSIWLLVVFIFICAISVSLLIRHNRRLAQSQRKLEEARSEAEEAIRNKSLFLSNMSHEIRTPLNALAGFSDILSMESVDKATREQCNDIIQLNSELLLKLINDVVDISCLDIEHMEFEIHPCDAVSLCHHVVQTLNAIKHTSAEISFHSTLDSLMLETDANRLQQVLINLIVNATKFTPEGNITLNIEPDDINESVCLSVTDTGCGISPEQQSRIFGRFEKLNETVQGTGLGLSICQLIIQRLGGKIWIDPEYTNGARFCFTHPLKQERRLL